MNEEKPTQKKKIRVRVKPKTGPGLLIRSASFGYVIENFNNVECKKGPLKGQVLPIITKNGRPAIFPDFESIPPNWRKAARFASQHELARGVMMDRMVTIETETEMSEYPRFRRK